MKKETENRYPNSATLFKFCKEALEIRYQGNVKVIDQDVGAILGYDPADCSHWKKGKKNIRALGTLKSIADHLKIDERLLVDITSGQINFEEAIFEYKGYGSFDLNSSHLENLKKSFFKDATKWSDDQGSQNLDEIFDLKRESVKSLAENILTEGQFEEAPIYLPELVQCISGLSLLRDANLDSEVELRFTENGEATLLYRAEEIRPHLRFLLCKKIFFYLLQREEGKDLNAGPEEIKEIRSNLFASFLLIPIKVFRKELEKIDHSKDVVQQMALNFWVSRSLMNLRIRDYLIYQS